MKINNIDVSKLKGTVEALKKDMSKAKKTNRIAQISAGEEVYKNLLN